VKKWVKHVELALAVLAVQILVGQGASVGQRGARQPVDAYGNALLAVGPLLFLARHRWPVAATAGTMAATVLYLLGGYPYGPPFVSMALMLAWLVIDGRRWAAWAMSAAMLLFFEVYAWLAGNQSWFHVIAISTFMALLMVAAELVRIVRERRATAERAEEEEHRRQASEERLTMAQELHDVLAHNISLIHVQAATALHLIDDHPEQARTALATIKAASKEVLGEMRSVLNVLREGAPRAPTAGLGQLDDLVARSGLNVVLKRLGTRPLPPQVERAAYRIVQESLTNVARHAPDASVVARLEYRQDELMIRVTDTGSSTQGMLAELGGGNGIPGMRERATALGGVLDAGPHGSGFQVTARLPLPEERS
jgi:signal transduction histidine kinase